MLKNSFFLCLVGSFLSCRVASFSLFAERTNSRQPFISPFFFLKKRGHPKSQPSLLPPFAWKQEVLLSRLRKPHKPALTRDLRKYLFLPELLWTCPPALQQWYFQPVSLRGEGIIEILGVGGLTRLGLPPPQAMYIVASLVHHVEEVNCVSSSFSLERFPQGAALGPIWLEHIHLNLACISHGRQEYRCYSCLICRVELRTCMRVLRTKSSRV